jgi:hypothetical protein
MHRALFKWIGIGVLITPICYIWAAMFGAGGHGTDLFLNIFFPYAALIIRLKNYPTMEIIIGLIQFPLYGTLIGFAKSKESSATIIWLLVVHTVAAILCFLFSG